MNFNTFSRLVLISCLIWSHLHFYKLWCNKVWQFKKHLKSITVCLMPPFCSNKQKKDLSLHLYDSCCLIFNKPPPKTDIMAFWHTYRERETEREGETGTSKISALAYESCICVSVCVCVVYSGLLYEAQWSVEWYSTLGWTWLRMSHSELKVMSRGTPQKLARSLTHTYYPCQHLPDKREFVEDRYSSANQAYVQLFWHRDHVIHAFLSQ